MGSSRLSNKCSKLVPAQIKRPTVSFIEDSSEDEETAKARLASIRERKLQLNEEEQIELVKLASLHEAQADCEEQKHRTLTKKHEKDCFLETREEVFLKSREDLFFMSEQERIKHAEILSMQENQLAGTEQNNGDIRLHDDEGKGAISNLRENVSCKEAGRHHVHEVCDDKDQTEFSSLEANKAGIKYTKKINLKESRADICGDVYGKSRASASYKDTLANVIGIDRFRETQKNGTETCQNESTSENKCQQKRGGKDVLSEERRADSKWLATEKTAEDNCELHFDSCVKTRDDEMIIIEDNLEEKSFSNFQSLLPSGTNSDSTNFAHNKIEEGSNKDLNGSVKRSRKRPIVSEVHASRDTTNKSPRLNGCVKKRNTPSKRRKVENNEVQNNNERNKVVSIDLDSTADENCRLLKKVLDVSRKEYYVSMSNFLVLNRRKSIRVLKGRKSIATTARNTVKCILKLRFLEITLNLIFTFNSMRL